MSRIGKQTVIVPAGTEVKLTGTTFSAKGPKGTLTRDFTGPVTIHIAGNEITFTPNKEGDRTVNALWGTYASHVKNMVVGVNEGYTKKLILEGVGFKSEVVGKALNLALGFSHPVKVEIPEGLTVTAEKNNVTVTGIDKELVGSFTASVRAMKKPEPYKGKGFRYSDEVIRRKQGKKAA
ncbi:50S ribosomal protein L6 [Candidatus Nomurabacteria bacterium RIFOXYC2_FULL_36_8]|nr:MAG: 50S ribosomal protein L6 [Candidatus Nomurabacteria bacterium GW2011_GWE2_36_115]KKP94547.1 MAG: 50S ribosomal protein L6 [Candidatus Nomurabacteria bacterium GW2011_GWF2_36_126]KKP97009.1 MAG: 50S ribosomal protein L6 [Candidatus Nomurabacteria bacterium GW2011_GWD2_36_14]KKP99387.1 MAG: 50S ribosomal protein L6 [Candidatus Nomurabacteria bacterium GW2011_GWF2_36_19]KKQ05757.1 MAG: 50S ribosomal protein L6 [Candidatus Nomurabacteria bacterium GW2011_GWF1_36_47]KKQ09525.1 MAG: 50S ribo